MAAPLHAPRRSHLCSVERSAERGLRSRRGCAEGPTAHALAMAAWSCVTGLSLVGAARTLPSGADRRRPRTGSTRSTCAARIWRAGGRKSSARCGGTLGGPMLSGYSRVLSESCEGLRRTGGIALPEGGAKDARKGPVALRRDLLQHLSRVRSPRRHSLPRGARCLADNRQHRVGAQRTTFPEALPLACCA